MTDYAGLKAEIALPEYTGMTDTQIAASLTAPINAPVDADAQAARDILMRSTTYDWGRIVVRSNMPLTGTDDDVILAAINLVQAFQGGMTQAVLRTSQPEDLAKLEADMEALEAAGDVSLESSDNILALTTAETTRANQLGFDPAIHDMEQEIAAARIWTP